MSLATVAASARAAPHDHPDPRNAVVSVGGHRRVSAVPTIHLGIVITKLTVYGSWFIRIHDLNLWFTKTGQNTDQPSNDKIIFKIEEYPKYLRTYVLIINYFIVIEVTKYLE